MTTTTTLPGYRTGTWAIDTAHTDIGFSVRHLMVSKVRGSFTSFEGTIETTDDPLASRAELTVDLSSIDTRNDDRDAHLRSGDFFDVDSHPTMHYVSTAVRLDGDGITVDGDLTIKAVTRPVTLRVEFNGIGTDPWGGERIGLSATGSINRKDFDITFDVPLDGGGVLVGDQIDLVIEESRRCSTPRARHPAAQHPEARHPGTRRHPVRRRDCRPVTERLPTYFISHGGGGPWPWMKDRMPTDMSTLEASLAAILARSARPGRHPGRVRDAGDRRVHPPDEPEPTDALRLRRLSRLHVPHQYPAPGAPAWRPAPASCWRKRATRWPSAQQGFDHGVFVAPLYVMYPGADVPIVQLSIRHDFDPAARHRRSARSRRCA
ncbi:MAG: YceI family protein [Acidimicrobiales bacterium]